MHYVENLQELNNLIESKFELFGAGKVAFVCTKYLELMGRKPQHINVTNPSDNPKELLGIPVRSFSETLIEDVSDIILIICVSRFNRCSAEQAVRESRFKAVYCIGDNLMREMVIKTSDTDDIICDALERIESEQSSNYRKLLRFVKKPCLEYMIVNILDHCNLRCKGCDHFACIAEERFYKRDDIRKDVERMSELFNGDYIMKIAVMGGEPLLHPELNEILTDVRHFFPYAIIRLTTNGLLLLKQGEEFWETCRDNHITIVNTKYPINLDFEKMKSKAAEEKVAFKFFEDTGDDVVKKSFKKTINLSGDSNPTEQFANCHISNYGNFLLEGKFYGCPFSAQSYRIFNKKFNQNLRLTDEDYIDIYKAKSKEEFFEFAARPKYYCRYCMGKSPTFTWSRSNQEMDEWV